MSRYCQNLEELPFETVDAKCRAWIRVALNEGLVSNYIRSLLDASHSGLLSTNYGVRRLVCILLSSWIPDLVVRDRLEPSFEIQETKSPN